MGWVLEPISKAHQTSGFDCGEESLNAFLLRYARQNDQRGLGRTFVLVEAGHREVMGFFTLATGSIRFETLPEAARSRLPRYPVPTIHIARLAVRKTHHGLGLGKVLLVEALRKAGAASAHVGVFAVDVLAKTEHARSFYAKYGFTSLGDDPLHLFLPIETARTVAGIAS